MAEDTKYGERAIEQNKLETFANPARDRDYEISISHPEFTCKCPRSGYPDFGTISIKYVPDELCVELKSWKLYINGYRDTSQFHEAVVNRIADDLIAAVRPRSLTVIGDFLPRGNVKTVITMEYEK